MDIKAILGDKYKEGMTAEEITSALSAVEVVTQSEHDRKINELSQSGIAKAAEKLRTDPKFMAKLEEQARAKILEDANKTAEEKASEIMAQANKTLKEASIKTNKATARELFSKANITADEYNDFIDMLVTDNEEVSTTNVTKYIEKYNGALKMREDKLKETYKKAEIMPKQGGNSNPDAAAQYKSDYAKAVASGDNSRAIYIMNKAAKENIKI